MRVLVDTNILVYDTIEDGEHHEEAAKIVDEASELYIPSIVVHEYIWVMLRLGVEPRIVALKVREYLEDPRTRYICETMEVIVNALRMLTQDEANIREVNDYIILATARYYGTSLATLDKRLRRVAQRWGVEVKP